MPYKLQLRRDLAEYWELNNPVLDEGEPGFETNTGLIKVGNGTDTWNNLSYIYEDVGLLTALTASTTYLTQSAASTTYATKVYVDTKDTAAIKENIQTISSNYTISSGNNALSAGKVTIGSGVRVTIPSGSSWAIV